jgi:hypothetical protein
MTHEHAQGDEPEGGPQHDHRLPDAIDIPVTPGPFDLEPEHWPDEWDDDDPPVAISSRPGRAEGGHHD